jgi:hypothetical protein
VLTKALKAFDRALKTNSGIINHSAYKKLFKNIVELTQGYGKLFILLFILFLGKYDHLKEYSQTTIFNKDSH